MTDFEYAFNEGYRDGIKSQKELVKSIQAELEAVKAKLAASTLMVQRLTETLNEIRDGD